MEKLKNSSTHSSVQLSAISMAICIFLQSIAPSVLYAGDVNISTNKGVGKASNYFEGDVFESNEEVEERLTPPIQNGGPDQPEVQSFTPIGTSDMVDPFTGNFSYNIPLMDVDGYPINIAYNAGVTMDQEATWVGLGWNLNPGVVNRNMRGIPDDFNGADQFKKEYNMKKNWTVGTSAGLGLEVVAVDLGAAISFSLGIKYNNYAGFGADFSVTPSFSVGGDLNVGASLGVSGSSQGGASLSPNLSFSKKGDMKEGNSVTNGINIGTSFNSRGGMSNISVGYSRSISSMGITGNLFKGTLKVHKMERGSTSAGSSFSTGMSTYTPQITMPTNSFSFAAKFRLGGDIIGVDATGDFSGYFSAQWLRDKSKYVSAYGYMNLQKGQDNKYAMLDFNRENDGVFTKHTPALPIPSLTYDVFSVSGQGVGGSYRAYRPDVGYVFDPKMATNAVDASVGGEVGFGATFKAGIDVSGVYTRSKSESWSTDQNKASESMRFVSDQLYFREANELSVDNDPAHYAKIGGEEPLRLHNPSISQLKNEFRKNNGAIVAGSSSYVKTGQEKRNQVIYTLTNGDLRNGLGIQELHSDAFSQTSPAYNHHIGQFTTLNTDGTRYVYGIAAYSHVQRNVSFAVGASNIGVGLEGDCNTGLVTYSSNDASVNNKRGLDNHFNALETPPFAHSYLLTTVLNADYIDADKIKGPSKGDLGGYMRFSYKKVDNYQWRNPVNLNKAFFDEGLNADRNDDKGHYIYGEKELWYVDSIFTKNHVAVFYTSDRSDGHGVSGEHGNVVIGNPAMQQLDSIALFSLPELEANPSVLPLKVVHFTYDYSLCQGYDQNIAGGGKLTLKSIYFTYQGSNKGRYSPYTFNYGENPNYDMKSIDRWGGYKEKPVSCSGGVETIPLRPSDFPYVGYDKTSADESVAAWALSEINLPSGGKIEVDYESDEYAYVQHKRANQMFKIIGVEGVSPSFTDQSLKDNNDIYFELMPGTVPSDYGQANELIYFRALMRFEDQRYDFVPGYAEIESIGSGTYNGISCGKIKLKAAKLKDNGSADYHPIAVAAIQFGRIHLSKMLPPSSQGSVDGTMKFLDIAGALIGAFTSFGELFKGPNKPLWDDDIGTQLVVNKSWVRLTNPDKHKLGGGHRVKEIRMYDAWDEMSSSGEEFYYGQQYSYNLPDGSSSGVASYEPQIGGDENVWRQPIANNTKYLLAPDARNYQETPFGEQFFPGPSVGYSMVTIKDLPRTGVTRTATGKVIHEFYTAKDFPTITKRTDHNLERQKIPVFAILFSMSIDEMSASQGFVVETNDMHGKPKAQSVYAEGKTEPITKVEYFYQSEYATIDGIGANKLVNTVKSIRKDGTVSTDVVGRVYEAVADFRKSTSNMVSGSVMINLNYTLPFILLPMVLPSGSYERTAFKSASFTKVIERFGILKNTVAADLGSRVETNNLAYDAETGSVLLTQTTTDFNDKVYNFTYPAHWYYDGMGQAYKNVGFKASGNYGFSSGDNLFLNSSKFSIGDEVGFYLSGTNILGWVTEVSSSSIRILLKDGTPLNGTISNLQVLRSGRRNQQNTPIGTVALKKNPLDGLSSNIFEEILQAGAVEYTDEWRTFCECFMNSEDIEFSTNPFILGLKGSWRPIASYVHLSGRTQSFQNNNSNIREDGIFSSFTPFYEFNNGKWNIDRQNWTYTSSVTEFSPNGQALETVDALDRYSSSMFGYNQSLPIAISANTRYRQLGFDGFEDYDYDNCSDEHFRVGNGATIVDDEAHTGRKSIKVYGGDSLVYFAPLQYACDIPVGCGITIGDTLVPMGKGNYAHVIIIQNGVRPYEFDYEVINGNPTISTSEYNGDTDTFMAYSPSSEAYKLRLIVRDANGCEEIIEIDAPAY
jgi:hypothetical protein